VIPATGQWGEAEARSTARGEGRAGAVTAVGEAIDPGQLVANGGREGKGILAGAQALQRPELGRVADP
jgi:hypothetical protein